MKKDLFRKEAVEKIAGPEDLNTYIRVLNPRIWLFLLAIGIAMTGLIFFTVFAGFPVWDLFLGGTGG